MPDSLAQALMRQLYGGDIYEGFRPRRSADMQGWNSEHKLFNELVAGLRPGVIVDVGVWKGRSSIALAKLLRPLRPDGVVIAVDTFLGSPEHWRSTSPVYPSLAFEHGQPQLYWQFLSNIVHANCQDMVVPLAQTSENAAVILERLGVRADLVHIDAAHERDAVLRDAANYWRLLQPGGALVGDDYDVNWPGVVQGADSFAASVGLPLQTDWPKWLVRKP